MFHRETDAAKVARNRDAIFDLHAAALDWLERLHRHPLPVRQVRFPAGAVVPVRRDGAPGAIFYNASGLLLDESATQNQKLGRASVIAHETAHMWFGDLVTMRWFDDVWMKEVFANFMAAKIVNPSFPAINHELRFLLAYYPPPTTSTGPPGTNAIRQRLDNLNEAGTLYGAIIYQKAPIVMRQLEMIVGADGFRDGLREYLEAHAFGNATWPDLIALLDRPHARGPRGLEPRVGRGSGTAGRSRPSCGSRTDDRPAGVRAAGSGAASAACVWTQRIKVAHRRTARHDAAVPVALDAASRRRPRAAAACRRHATCCRTAAASPTADFALDDGEPRVAARTTSQTFHDRADPRQRAG